LRFVEGLTFQGAVFCALAAGKVPNWKQGLLETTRRRLKSGLKRSK